MESEFGRALKQGVFKVPVCTGCTKKVWPPSPICPVCYSKTILQNVGDKGVLIEFTTSHVRGHEGVFGLVEMDGFRLMGSFETDALRPGMTVRMKDCGVRDGAPYYLFFPEK